MPVVSEYRIDPTATKRTVYGSMMQSALSTATQHIWLENTTLNEKWNLQPKSYPEENPTIKYFGFGIGGQYMGKNNAGGDELMFYQYSPDQAALYNQIPLCIRDTDNDLDATQREFYAGRVLMNIGGVDKVVYWLGRLDLRDTTTEAYKGTPNGDGTVTEVPFEPSSDVLNPIPQVPATDTVNLVTGEYLITRSILQMRLASWQLDELINAKQIMTGTSTLNVNEILIAHGCDVSITSTDGITYNEGLGIQATAFFPRLIGINSYVGEEFLAEVDAGIDDPLTLALITSGS